MPLYYYECSLCSYRFEERMSYNDDTVRWCPKCGGRARRIITVVPHLWRDGHEPNRRSKVNPNARRVKT